MPEGKGLSFLYSRRISLNECILVRNSKENLRIVIYVTDEASAPCYLRNMRNEWKSIKPESDDALTAVYEANACDANVFVGDQSTWADLCGYPLDDEGRCEVHG